MFRFKKIEMTFIKLCVLFGFIGLTSAGKLLNDAIIGPHKVMYYDLETNKSLNALSRNSSSSHVVDYNTETSAPCKCIGHDCKCCTGIRIKNLNIRQEACSRVLYYPEKRALDVSLIYNDRKLAQGRYSVDGPSPLCAPLPLPVPFTGLIKLCLQLYDINIADGNLHTCVDIQTHILDADTPVLVLHFNCYTVGLSGFQYIPAP